MVRIARTTAALLVSALALPVAAAAQQWTSARPDGHAPIGVMADHTHEAGEMMLSYRFMNMLMEGLRSDSDGLTPDDVLDDYMVTPLEMPMRMHMAGVMFAPSDRVTLIAMVPFVSMEMDHQTRTGAVFTTESSGIGDVRAGAMVVFYDQNRIKMHFNFGLSAPTGSVDEMDATPASAGADVQLPYPMQIGSGTWDLRPGITYLGQKDTWSWGAQAMGAFRLGENDRGYTLGNSYMGTAWWALLFNDWISGSVRVEANNWGNIEGADPDLNPNMVPTADSELRGGTRVDALAGVNFEWRGGSLNGNRLAVEFGMPVYQSLDGPQLETDWTLTIGWQLAFALIQ